MPTAFVLGFIVLMLLGLNLLVKWRLISDFRDAEGLVEVFCVAGSIAWTLGLGYFDARLKRQQEKISRENNRSHDGLHVLRFFLLQLALVPCLMMVLWVVMEMVARVVRP